MGAGGRDLEIAPTWDAKRGVVDTRDASLL